MRTRLTSIIAAIALIVTGFISFAGGGTASAASAPYKIGFLTAETGAYATALAGSLQGAEARIAVANAAGGVNGHKLQLVSIDDGSSPTSILTAVQNAVQNQGINVLATTSYLTSVVAPYLHAQGFPVVGADYDGPEWGTQPYTNMFGNWGPLDPSGPTYTTYGLYMKQLGATKIACVANNIPGGIADCNSALAGSVYLGMKKQYEDTTAPLTQTTFSTIALGLKNSGANGVLLEYGPQQNAALLEAMAQEGFKPKALLLSSSYGQSFLSTPALLQAAHETGALFGSYFTPIQANTSGTKAFQAALKKYEHITGTPSFQNYEGYTSIDLAVTALTVGGSSPTKSSIIKGMQTKVTGDTQGGLSSSPVSWPLSKFGTGPIALGANGCNYALRIVGSKYVMLNSKPTCGKEVK